MAFQPIVDTRRRDVFAWQATIQGPDASPPGIQAMAPEEVYAFDLACRVGVMERATHLGMTERLAIRFAPRSIYAPDVHIRHTVDAARRLGFPSDRLIFEVSEEERVMDPEHFVDSLGRYRSRGLATALDNYGAGYAGLSLLADFQPDLIKLDSGLVRDIHINRVKRSIAAGTVTTARALGTLIIAQGVECRDELDVLQELGIHLFQGNLFARPALETLPQPHF